MSAFNFAVEPRREVREITSQAEWLTWRKHDVTASRVGVLFDCHPFLKLPDMLAEMRGQSTKGDTPAMRRGRWLQPAIVTALKDERPEWRVSEASTYHRFPDLRLAGTPDIWVDEPLKRGAGIIEAKTFSEYEWYERHHARLPLGYTVQTLALMMVTGARWGAVAVLIVSSSLPLYIIDVPRHAAAEARILDAVARFWQQYDAGEFPQTTPPDELEQMMDDGSHLDLSDNPLLPELLAHHEEMVELHGDAKRKLDDIKDQIKALMGPAANAWLPGWNITYKKVHYKEYTMPARDQRNLYVRRTMEHDDG